MEEDASLFPKKELLDNVPLVEDERDELEDREFEAEFLPGEAGNSADSGCLCPEKQHNADADISKKKTAIPDGLQARHLRKTLSHLEKLREEKELFIQKTRGELRACRQRMDLITKQQASVSAEVAAEKEANNTAAVGRLQAVSRRLCTELNNERDLQSKIRALLQKSESSMWHIAIQERPLKDGPKSAQEEEVAGRKRLQEQAAKEEAALEKAERNRLLRARKSIYLQREHGLRHQKLVEDAQKNHKIAVRFLKASLRRIREQERKEERKSRAHMKRRMDAVLALKNSITANRETLRKFQAWGQAKAELAEQKAQAEKEMILAQGGDAFKHLFHQRRCQELDAQKRTFEEEQKLRKQEIVSRILKEAAEEENRKKKQSSPAKATDRLTLRDKTWRCVTDVCEGRDTAVLSRHLLDSDGAAHPKAPQLLEAISSESVQGDPGNTSWEDDTLAEPEVPGLWKEDYKPYQVPKEEVARKTVGGTKMDKDILARTTEQVRCRVTHKRVVSRCEFKGRPFNSKPKLIHFKDFDIGKVYKKKITLINATYTINYCKLVGVEDHLQDFIHIEFDPPGPMSAGMSCEVLVTFKPMINKDLEGNISFMAQTGGFSVPLKCSPKKCALSLDKELIDFGSYVVGETTSRTITLTNIGGLGTKFKFLPASESYEMDISQSVMKISSVFTDEDKSLYDRIITSISEQQIKGNESSPTDMPSQKESGKRDSKEQEEGRPTESEGVTVTTVVTIPPNEEQTEISLGEVTEGEIGPFSSIKVPVIFTPIIPGEVQTKFKVVFKNQQCPTLYFRVVGVAIDVPVWVPKPNVDLKMCMYDRLYQDSVLVHTRSKVALRLKFEVCKELREHMELLPETGYIQAQSSYAVQLKFLPRHSLPEDAGKYFDKESRVLEAPMTIRVADQIKPVGFTVHAVVTTSDLELSPSAVDFGYCTIYEAIRTQVSLYNHSLLPQGFGFVGLPKFVDIQPNDGFGTILPLEMLHLDVIFQPTKAKEYNFELVCKSEINRCFQLACRAVGVHPPLELSHYQVKFAATSLYDMSVATLYVINSHVSMNSLTHSVPRIGSEDASPVGPTSFEFLPPPDSPITISPSVGTVLPGKRCLIQVVFRPVLPSKLIHQEASQALTKPVELRKDTATQRKDLRRQSSTPRLQNQDRLHRTSTTPIAELCEQDFKFSSDEYQAAQATLARSFQGKFDKFVVPCVVASGDTKDRKGTEPLSFSPHNTLYLELWCPAVAPSIVVTSNRGKTISNFGDIAVGHHGIKKVSIQNISAEDLAVEFSMLNPNGPFVLLNAISKLLAGETHVLTLSFSPHESILAQETLDIITKRGTLSLTLLGTGVASMITCSIEGNTLDMGYVIARESVSSSFKLQNCSTLPIKFSLRLDSLSRSKSEDQQRLPQFLASRAQRTEVVGTQNNSGQSVFSVIPVKGIMDPGKAQDFTVTFSPDHESLYFSDRLQIVLFEKKLSHQILLKGAAREHMMFVEGGDPLDVPVESLTVIPTYDPERREEAEELKPILVTLDYIQLDTDTPAPPATRELQVGCIRTTQLSPKKTVEFSLDSSTALQHKGFTIEPSRGSVERGQTKTISISWMPPADFDPDHPLMVSALLQLKGDVKETYKVLFVAQVVTGP
ncbi:cilia- and flagella-associated protein 74 isoform X1 [Zalophus californianus]|uniref:Cilia- and flagella-associated protein 74 n=1 Tax=Zalophus californianus TaxID=9704 RepID=A0A6J2C7W7_ZALCA|nr:cilia- and flagella-associated protein 74 isoform X1 [Zalophus californianus]XP_027438128.2 cilia- and flagella-associated protein 74 isoform X1 [Zalophus californianus]XP_027438137.2 cilia- and flagella-associated protein 74 isoform X1 [Zalophus californianus]